jgi:hypothetical protein
MAEDMTLESVADDAMDSIADDAPEAPAEGVEATQKGQQAEVQGAAEKPAEGAQAPEPEDYTLDAEDFNIPADNLQSFTEACKAAKLSKAQAEAMLSWHRGFAGDVDKARAAQESAVIKQWQDELIADPEVGGVNWKGAVADCRRVLARYDTDGSLRALLKAAKADYHPAVVRTIARIGREMREDNFVTSKGGGNSAKALEDRMWPDMQV